MHLLWCQVCIHLVEGLERLWRLRLEGRLAGQALEHDRSQAPQVGLRVVLQRHYHFGGLKWMKTYSLRGTLRFTNGKQWSSPCTWESRTAWRP